MYFSYLVTNNTLSISQPNSCKCCLKSQYTKYLCIIFKTCRQLPGASPQIPTEAPPLDPAAGKLPSPDPLICSPLEKKSCGRKWLLFEHCVQFTAWQFSCRWSLSCTCKRLGRVYW